MNGLLGALDPLTSQAHGAGDVQAVRRHLRAGTRAALLLSCASWAGAYTGPLLIST